MSDPVTAPEVVVLMTTWNRSKLLRQSLPQVEREARSIGARLVIADDQSDDDDTLSLLEGARRRGAELIRRDYVRAPSTAEDSYVHHSPKVSLKHLLSTPSGRKILSADLKGLTTPDSPGHGLSGVHDLWESALHSAHVNAQYNNLFGFRHVVTTYPTADRILKIDDDVALADGCFRRMLSAWRIAESDGHDVLALSGIRTVNEAVMSTFPGYVLTVGICNVAVLYRRTDWETYLNQMPIDVVVRDGFDLTFAWQYAPQYRPGSVAVSVAPSVVYHTGANGLHVRNVDLNCEFSGSTEDIIVQ